MPNSKKLAETFGRLYEGITLQDTTMQCDALKDAAAACEEEGEGPLNKSTLMKLIDRIAALETKYKASDHDQLYAPPPAPEEREYSDEYLRGYRAGYADGQAYVGHVCPAPSPEQAQGTFGLGPMFSGTPDTAPPEQAQETCGVLTSPDNERCPLPKDHPEQAQETRRWMRGSAQPSAPHQQRHLERGDCRLPPACEPEPPEQAQEACPGDGGPNHQVGCAKKHPWDLCPKCPNDPHSLAVGCAPEQARRTWENVSHINGAQVRPIAPTVTELRPGERIVSGEGVRVHMWHGDIYPCGTGEDPELECREAETHGTYYPYPDAPPRAEEK